MHVLVKTLAEGVLSYRLECPGKPHCDGYTECREKHEIDGTDASDGPFECPPDQPWYEQEEFEFHGVLHTWHDWCSWTVPFKGCVVAAASNIGTDWGIPDEIREQPPGRYLIRDEWDEDMVRLEFVGPEGDS